MVCFLLFFLWQNYPPPPFLLKSKKKKKKAGPPFYEILDPPLVLYEQLNIKIETVFGACDICRFNRNYHAHTVTVQQKRQFG